MLFRSGKGKYGENRVQEIAEISRGLKSIARELNIPILALAQLSRAVEATSPAIPKLSHLRDSGSIEQDADIVVLLSKSEEGPESLVDVAKQRGGGTGEITMRLIGSEFRFQEEAKEFYQGRLIE